MATYMYDIREAAQMTRSFVWHNIRKPLLSLFPYWLACALVVAMDNPKEPSLLSLAGLPLAFLGILLATNFHRAYMQNHETTTINPLKPQRNDWRFIGVTLVLLSLCTAIAGTMGLLGYLAGGKTGTGLALLISLPIVLYIALRLAFLYPDRATGGTLSYKAAYEMSNGLVWRIFITPFYAGWKWLLGAAVWIFVATTIAAQLAPKIDEQGDTVPDITSPIFKITNFILTIPAEFFMTYYFTALTVTALSNYYLWARNNPYRK